jgi:large subunit ribosomal protein L21
LFVAPSLHHDWRFRRKNTASKGFWDSGAARLSFAGRAPANTFLEAGLMYAVIRAGGKQYRVAPGDVIKVEKTGSGVDSVVEFNDVLAVSPVDGQITKANGATVTGQVVQEDRHKKILVFHLKRKKQYKKMRGHRQDFTAVRITEIAFEGQKFSAPALEKKAPKKKKVVEAPEVEAAPKGRAKAKAKAPAKKAAAKKAPAKKAASKKKK